MRTTEMTPKGGIVNISDNHSHSVQDRKTVISPVPTVAVMVLVWVTASVLLTLSMLTQRDFTILKKGDTAPFSTWALTDFRYVDRERTNSERENARQKVRSFYRIDGKRSDKILEEFEDFVTASQTRMEMEQFKQKYIPGDNAVSRMVAGFKNFSGWSALLKDSRKLALLRRDLQKYVSHGILEKPVGTGKHPAVITPDGRELDDFVPPSAANVARNISGALRESPALKAELCSVLAAVIGKGNLTADTKLTRSAQDNAAAQVPEFYKECRRGELLIAQGDVITPEMVDKIQAEKNALPQNFGMGIFYYRLGVSLLLLVVAFIFFYATYPDFFRHIHQIMLAGAVVILSMVINYAVIYLFFHLFRKGDISDYQLLFAFLPISLCAALSTAFLGNRAAIFCIFLVASVSAMMAFPDRSFEQALRWFFTGVLLAFAVRNVHNYRSFFFRVFFFGAFNTALINSDMLFRAGRKVFAEAAVVILGNSFGCAVASLLLIFAFELIFNADTNMSLMMLCDHSHKLLDELKRKAPGTMFHSMNVATLAEDAASAIRANPLKAKAGALFHDIGKLTNPHFFVENNVDSPGEHEKLPPRQSCNIIREHVSEGMNLSRKYRLSRFIRKAISTHHGDDLVSFFYRKAVEYHDQNPGSPPVFEADFRYGGEAPDECELTIISLADACEAACRSLKTPAESSITEMVEKIFMHRFRQGQLRNSQLTLRELNVIKECFINDLVNFNHGRIAYNKEKNDDPAEQSVVLPEQKSSEKK